MLKHFVIFISLIFPLFSGEYRDIAENFLKFKNIEKSIVSTETLQKDNQDVGYLFLLSDGGYIVVPISKLTSPIKSYSLIGTELVTPFRKILEDELYNFLENDRTLSRNISGRISKRWDFLENFTQTSSRVLNSYIPNTNLLTTTWNQGYPYNKFFPEVDETTTLTGCVQTAMAQLMNYHQYPTFGKGVLEHNASLKNSSGNHSRYENMVAVLYRNYNWELMSDNYSEYNETQADEVGYLMRDLVIMNKASIGTSETSASNNSYAMYKNFGYSKNYKSASSSDHTFLEIFNIIVEQIDLEQPVLFSLPNHMVVADGYQDDSTGKYVHLNMGWGGSSDDFYNIDDDIIDFAQATNNDIHISYDLKPCSESEGDCFVNLEENESIHDYENLTLENNDTVLDYENLTLEDGDTINENTVSGELDSLDDKDYFEIYLSGDTNITRENQYFNIAIYTLYGTLLEESLTENININLDTGRYKILLSRKNSSGTGYSHWETMNYNLTISTDTISESEKEDMDNLVNRKNI